MLMLKALFFLKIFQVSVMTFWSCRKKGLNRKIKLTSKFMTSQPGQQTITIHILPNISRSKLNQTMKLRQLIEYNKINIFLQKSCGKWDWQYCTKKWSFPLRMSSVNVTKSAGICPIAFTFRYIWQHVYYNCLLTSNHFHNVLRLWCFTKFSFHHNWNNVRLLLMSMVYTGCLTNCRTV